MSKFRVTLDQDEAIASKSQLSSEVSERNKLYKQNQKLISECKIVVEELKRIYSYSGIEDLEKSLCRLQQVIKDCEI